MHSPTGASVLASFTLLYVVLHQVRGQASVSVQARWLKTALQGVSFHGYKAEYQRESPLGCAAECLRNSPCYSFSFHGASHRCLVFPGRVSFGVEMQLDEGYSHYWRLADACPNGYLYNSSVQVCYKPVASPQLSWIDAFYHCSNESGHLYISNTYSKRDVLADYIRRNNFTNMQFKLGGNDLFREGWWAWLDGSPVVTWYTAQPDDAGEQDCMENTRGYPDCNNDGICSTADRYVCQIPLQ